MSGDSSSCGCAIGNSTTTHQHTEAAVEEVSALKKTAVSRQQCHSKNEII